MSNSDSLEIVWVPFKPEAEIKGKDYISVDQPLSLEIITYGILQEKITFKWTVSPEVDSSNFYKGDD